MVNDHLNSTLWLTIVSWVSWRRNSTGWVCVCVRAFLAKPLGFVVTLWIPEFLIEKASIQRVFIIIVKIRQVAIHTSFAREVLQFCICQASKSLSEIKTERQPRQTNEKEKEKQQNQKRKKERKEKNNMRSDTAAKHTLKWFFFYEKSCVLFSVPSPLSWRWFI